MFDCSLNSDGAGAVVVTSTERAKSLKQKPVLIKGFATHNNTKGWIEEDHMLSTGADESGERAFKMAGLGPKDVDTAQIYDCFTYMVLDPARGLRLLQEGRGRRVRALRRAAAWAACCRPTRRAASSRRRMSRACCRSSKARGNCRASTARTGRSPDAEIALVSGHGGNQVCHSTLILGRA